MTHAVRTAGLYKRYGGQHALRPIDVELAAGDGAALVGANGTGKTTLLRLLVGLVWPSGGESRIFGVKSHDPSCRIHVGYAPETPPSRHRAPVGAALIRLGRLSGLSATDAAGRAAELTTRLGLEPATRIGALSRGALQRLILAQALVHRPRLLLLDEPLGGLDRRWRDSVVALLTELRGSGVALVVATHVPELFGPALSQRWDLDAGPAA